MTAPLVSVVTPFHNTAAYLAQCIESVLAQTYENFEYLLVDNCSTDTSGEIAEGFARRDARIRLIRRTELLSQVQNYNGALSQINGASKYCKMVQADDFIFPDCLTRMVDAFEQSESIGLASAYDLKANVVRGSGFPYGEAEISGREVARMYFRKGIFPFGSPTTVMYRASLIHGQDSFFEAGRLHEDTEKCLEILEKWDFVFIPQVLSFIRVDNQSISSSVRSFQPDLLDRYILVKRYASIFLEQSEASALQADAKGDYYRALAHAALRFRKQSYWEYQQQGLKTIGETINWLTVLLLAGCELLWMAVNPGQMVARVIRNREPDVTGQPDTAARQSR